MSVWSGRQGVAHILGLVITCLALLLLVVGCIVVIVLDSNTIGIILTAVGAGMALMASVYVCVAFRSKWKLYGVVKVRYPNKQLARVLTMLPSKDDLHDSTVGTERNTENKSELGWNPESVLPD